VLRGPQGTLYGDDTVDGVMRFVTMNPSVIAVARTAPIGTTSISLVRLSQSSPRASHIQHIKMAIRGATATKLSGPPMRVAPYRVP
jgi:outer membrane cobalamin receptor